MQVETYFDINGVMPLDGKYQKFQTKGSFSGLSNHQ